MKSYIYALLSFYAISGLILFQTYATMHGIELVLASTWFTLANCIIVALAIASIVLSIIFLMIRFGDESDAAEARRELSHFMRPLWGICYVPGWVLVFSHIQLGSLIDGVASFIILFALLMFNSIARKGAKEIIEEAAKKGTTAE